MSFTIDSLSKDSISTLVNMKSSNSDASFKPVLQILSLKNMGPGSNREGQDRFRVILSDGTHFIQGMLATQLKGVVDSGELQQDSIVRVNDFMNNNIQGRNIAIILEIEVLGTATQRLGQPKEFSKSGTAPGTSAPAAPAPMYNRTNTPHMAQQQQDVKPSPQRSAGHNPYTPPKSSMNRSNAPIVQANAAGTPGSTPITPISRLSLYQNRWTVKARVVNKSDIRTWSNAKGEGSLFSIELLDSSGFDIKATMFKEAVEKFYNFFQVNSVYTISGGRLKVADQKWNTCKSQYEMSLDPNAEVKLADDSGEIQMQSFDFIKIGSLEQIEPNKNVDVIGIVQEVGDCQTLISKKTGKELFKSDILIVDDTGVQVRLTLWGNQAQNAQKDIEVHKAVAFRRARVSDYGGVSLSGSQSFHVEPPVPETEELQDWWKSQGSRGAPVKSLSSSGGGGGSMDSFENRKTIGDIKAKNLGYNNEKGDYLCFKANFTFFKKDKEGGAWYCACPNKEDPCRNRCKVTQTTDGNWQCDRCQGTYPNCTRKWIFSGVVADATGSTWVSLFDEQAHTLFGGVTADQAFAEYENQDLYDSHFAKANFGEWQLKCRVKNEMVNDEPRLKTTVVKLEPLDYVKESRDILKALEAF